MHKTVNRSRMWRWIAFVLLGSLMAAGMGALAPTPAVARAEKYKLDVENKMGADVEFCLRSVSSGVVRDCTGKINTAKTDTLYIDFNQGEQIYLDYEVFGEHTHDGNLITGASQCTLTGTVTSPSLSCNIPNSGNVYKVDVDNKMGADTEFCIRTTTSATKRACSGRLQARKTATLYIEYKEGDVVYLDFEIFGEHTHDGNVITGGHQCTAEGIINFAKVDCHIPKEAGAGQKFTPAPMAPYALDVANPNAGVMALLGLLAWCVSACCVAGLLLIGISMALQLNRGVPGEFGEHWRGTALVAIACFIGTTAGPIVAFLDLV
ncbi:hypothetical protein [Pseudosporangium ferrugineum]|uniref:DUF4190 domain-containing protein n=1 Tax=Pseudosporangium ferrugineum TaxID=439699 RepID=A0A2T0S840_9ACTN|nr:hypothetical protein [Pseudosporangium ferrugineum]PRY29588.1 hypothetical protein CLV70_106309 [Pseudosporangium ferrugineum]